MPGYEVSYKIWYSKHYRQVASVKYLYLTGSEWYFGGVWKEEIASFEALAVESEEHEYFSQSLTHFCTSFLSIRGLLCMLQLKEPLLK